MIEFLFGVGATLLVVGVVAFIALAGSMGVLLIVLSPLALWDYLRP